MTKEDDGGWKRESPLMPQLPETARSCFPRQKGATLNGSISHTGTLVLEKSRETGYMLVTLQRM